MDVQVYIVNAFSSRKDGGSTTAVVPHAENLETTQMQDIAARLNLPETVFSFPPDGQKPPHIHFFTPTQEIDVCRYSSIAALRTLRKLDLICEGRCAIRTRAGEFEAYTTDDDHVFVQQPLPALEAAPCTKKELLDILRLNDEDIPAAYKRRPSPIQFATGSSEILVPIVDLRTLAAVEPDLERSWRLQHSTD